MAVLKVACPKCGQRVSGDDSFYGTSVDCPVCTAKVVFPEKPGSESPPPAEKKPEESKTGEPDSTPTENPPSRDTESIPLPQSGGTPPPAEFDDDHPGSPLLGIISMVIGIVTVVCLCLPGILLGPIAVVCGHLGLASSRRSRVRPAPGENMALVGLILGYVGMAVSLVYLVMLAFPDLPQSIRPGDGGGPVE